MSDGDEDMIEVHCEIVRQTPKAIGIRPEGWPSDDDLVWLPVSQIDWEDDEDVVFVPRWLASKKGLP